jgi:hypothetical protein
MGLLWPTRLSANPNAVQVIARIIHWIGAIAGVYYLGAMLKYLWDEQGMPDWGQVAKWVMLACGAWFGGRGIRFVFGKE